MASYTVTRAKHATLVAATVDTVTLASTADLLITNRHATEEIYVRLDGTAPTVGGNESLVVLPGQAKLFELGGAATSVKLISAGAAAYSVEGY